MKQVPSPNFSERRGGKTPTILIMHYTAAPSGEVALDWLTDPSRKVSAHYLVDVDGEVIQLVDEGKRAWHAGVSFWAGETDINSASIGIEIQNPDGRDNPYPDAQIESLIKLSKGILSRHAIPAKNILGHSDVAPGRKRDPGEKFPWQRLAGEGIGLWPDERGFKIEESFDKELFVQALGDLGFDVSKAKNWNASISAFLLHWHPENFALGPNKESFRRLLSLLDRQ